MSVVEDGRLFRENLPKAGKDEAWVKRVLSERGVQIRDTFLLTVDAEDQICWIGKEDRQ